MRGPVQILPRDLLGIPILTWAIAQKSLPTGIVDFINAPVIRLAVGPFAAGTDYAAPPKGPAGWSKRMGGYPLLDIGTLAKIKMAQSKYVEGSTISYIRRRGLS